MWRSRTNRDRKTVDCIACGASVLRTEAREYDKEGDRWSRHDKEFEHLCKGCYRELDHQPRGELEALVVDIEERGQSRATFLRRYLDAVYERYGDGDGGGNGDAGADRDVSGLPPGDESAHRRWDAEGAGDAGHRPSGRDGGDRDDDDRDVDERR